SLFSFFVVNFAFAGVMFAVWMIFKPNGMQFQNGSVYFNFSFASLIVTAFVCYLSVYIFNRIMKQNAPQNQIYTIKINLFGKEVEGQGLLDTGNNLTDGFMGTPVIVAKRSFISSLIPKELESYFDGNFEVQQKKIPREWSARIRLVPAITLNATTLLPSFRPESIKISDDKVFKHVIIAVCPDNKLRTEYDCLLNTELLSEFGGEKSEAVLAKSGVGN
ncbi:MAG: sigma-E processing peptidase SpoIIGA, partial [Oscillospiraceae bacterium]|nr:sigma-E processing peptidase SpoIIGA [Oscillospiraceae bacterium]